MKKVSDKSLIENFAFVLLSILVLILTVIVVVMLVASDNKSVSDILNSIGSFTSGVGTLLATAAAISGLATWKKQITYGKHLELIWKAQVACQNVFLNVMAYFAASATPRPTAGNVIEAYERTRSMALLSRRSSEQYLGELVLACQHLDSLVTKTELTWTIRANRLNHSFASMANEFDARTPEQNSHNAQYFSDIYNSLESLKKDLEDLELRYS